MQTMGIYTETDIEFSIFSLSMNSKDHVQKLTMKQKCTVSQPQITP